MSIAATALEFLALALVTREGWRLAPLVLPYLLVLGVLAVLVGGARCPGAQPRRAHGLA